MQELNQPKLEGVWKYLQDSGVLDDPNAREEDYQRVRAEYWRLYRRNHKSKRRKVRPEISVCLDNHEMLEAFKKEAKSRNRTLSAFIRESVLAYLNKNFVCPRSEDWKQVQQALYSTEIAIKQIEDEDEEGKNYHRNYELLIERLMDLEQNLESVLYNPEILEEAIKNTVQKKPWYKSQLEKLIHSL